MKVITKYISKQIISIFLLCQFIFALLYLVIFFIRRIDNFIEAQVHLFLILLYFLYNIPTIVMRMTPLAITISIIVVISQMKKNKEVMAMKACGLNLHKAFQPIIIISLIISILSFFIAEVIVPYTSTRSNEIWEIEVKKHPQASFLEWYKSEDNNIYWIKHFDTETNTISDPIFYFFDDQFNLTKKISGKVCRWLGDAWEMENANILILDKDITYSTVKHYHLEIPETPETFITKRKKPDDMNYGELRRRAEKQKSQGYDNATDLVNLYMKLSFPLIGLVFSLIAIPIGLWEKTESIPLSVTIGILSIFVFWIVMGFAKTLGSNGTLPPLLSAWTANILFALLGLYLFMDIKR